MKTHFAEVELANESDNNNYWSEPICNTQTSDDVFLSNEWMTVSCKKCLKRKEQYIFERAMEMQHSCEDVAGFIEFMEREKGLENNN